MALDCKREAFKPGPGCPEISVSLKFPDFAACGDADPARLKGISKMDLQKSPAFPAFVPANDPLPVYIPDLDALLDDIDCVFDSYDKDATTVRINGKISPDSSVDMVVGSDCQIEGFDIDIAVDVPRAPTVSYKNGAVLYTFYADTGSSISI